MCRLKATTASPTIATHKATIMEKQTNSNGENMPDISSLTSEADRLSQSIGFWNTAIIVLMVGVAMVATGLVIAQQMAFRKADALAAVTDQLSKLKEGAANQKIADANERAGRAEEGAGKANERAAKAQASLALAEQYSAEAKAKAESFRLDIANANESSAKAQAQVAGATAEAAKANLELARIKMPRSLNPEQQKRVAQLLARFSGTDFAFVVFSDPESLALLGDIDSTLQQAGWNRVAAPPSFGSDIGFNTTRGMVFQANDVGLKVSFPPDAPMMEPIVLAVASAISAEGVPCEPHFSDRLKGTKIILISVGQKRL
jgi:hypothetical protein